MKINNRFEIGQIVYLKTDPDQKPRIVTAICVRSSSSHYYHLAQGTDENTHFEIEISEERDVLMAVTS